LGLNSPDVPLRATRIGVRGDELSVGGGYRWHEARRLSGQVTLIDMDDGNQRRSIGLNYRQRLRNGTRHRLYGQLDGFASSNSGGDRIYFNPERDWSLLAGVGHEWVVHQRYDRAFIQRLGVDAGNYWQKDFGSGFIWTLRLEHEWRLSDALSLGYGVSTGVRRYDGDRENMDLVFLSLRTKL
jgi:biofilm PGA synthesis protein PgaA